MVDDDKTEGTATRSATAHRKASLGPAGQSGDPVVQKLLAERQGHALSILPDPDLEAQRAAAQKAVDEIDRKLADLGYSVS